MRKLIVLTLLASGLMALHHIYQPVSQDRESRLAAVTRILTGPAIVADRVTVAAKQPAQPVREAPSAPQEPVVITATDLKTGSLGEEKAAPVAPIAVARPMPDPPAASPAPPTPVVATEASSPWKATTLDTPSPVAAGPLTSTRPGDYAARYELVLALQRELKRVSCYRGPVDGSWGKGSKRAMRDFIKAVNASLPLDEPDYILLTLLQSQQAGVCEGSCPKGQDRASTGECLPRAILARNAEKPAGREVGRAGEERIAAATVPQPAATPSRPFPRTEFDGRMSIGAPMPAVPVSPGEGAAAPSRPAEALAALEEDDTAGDDVEEQNAGDDTVSDTGDGSYDAGAAQRPRAGARPDYKRAAKPSRQKVGNRTSRKTRSVQNLFMHPLGRM